MDGGGGSLEQLLKDNEVDGEILALLAAKPFEVTTIKMFANRFESRNEVITLFLSTTKFKDSGANIANLKQAWREADSAVTRGLKRSAEGLPEENVDDPLRSAVEESLKSSFGGQHAQPSRTSPRSDDLDFLFAALRAPSSTVDTQNMSIQDGRQQQTAQSKQSGKRDTGKFTSSEVFRK